MCAMEYVKDQIDWRFSCDCASSEQIAAGTVGNRWIESSSHVGVMADDALETFGDRNWNWNEHLDDPNKVIAIWMVKK